MAGTISLSLSQQFDAQGRPLSGGLLYFFSSGTTTPQNAFQDFALTIAHPNPIILDASGRVPAFYLADGFIKIRLTDEDGVTIIAADGLLVVGPSTGGGGGASIDPNAVLKTGDIKSCYQKGTESLPGFVRCNGRTIGSASASTTERSNADCQALFEYLWTADPTLVVSGGRGASGNADWLANKSIALPDLRGRVIAGLDDMGAAAAGRLNIIASTLGNASGFQLVTLSASEIPSHTHTGTTAAAGTHSHTGSGNTGNQSANHSHLVEGNTVSGGLHSHTTPFGIIHDLFGTATDRNYAAGGSTVTTDDGAHTHAISINSGVASVDHVHGFSFTTSTQTDHTHTFTTASTGGGVNHHNTQPFMMMTYYIKL